MFLAIWFLANDGRNRYCIKNSHTYEELRKRFSEYVSNKFKGHSFNKGLYEKFSEDKKLEIKEKQKKTRLLNGTNPIGEKNGMFGKHWSEHPYTETPEQKEQRVKKAVETRRKNGSYKHSIEQDAKVGKAVRCIEDDLTFISMNRCEKYYGIRRLMKYIQENNGLHPKINKHFELASS